MDPRSRAKNLPEVKDDSFVQNRSMRLLGLLGRSIADLLHPVPVASRMPEIRKNHGLDCIGRGSSS